MVRDDRWILATCLDETYGLHLRHALEIIFRPRILALPGLEPPLCGLIIWQGRSLPVASLRLMAGRPEPCERPSVLIVGDEGRQIGLLADEIGDTVPVPERDLFPLSPVLTKGRPYLSQAFLLKESLVFALDIETLLRQLAPLAGALPAGQPSP